MARPSKYNAERHKKIIDALSIGTPFRWACAYAGIDEETGLNWRKRYGDFSRDVQIATGGSLVGWLAIIERAATGGDWRAAAWKASHTVDEFRDRQVTELQGADGGPIEVVSVSDVSLTDTERAARLTSVLERLRARSAGLTEPGPADLDTTGGPADRGVAE